MNSFFLFTKRIVVISVFALSSVSSIEIFSEETISNSCDYTQESDRTSPWYGLFGTGYAYSLKAGIQNPDSNFWDNAIQGYDANLGGSPFFTIGFGRSFFSYLKGDVSYTYFQGFHFQKFQSGSSATPGFTGGRRTRFFDLDHQNVMFNLSLYPEKHFYFSMLDLDISPFIGVGIGAGFYRVSNFHTVAYAHQVGSTTSIGYKTTTSAFAWQASSGIRIHPMASCFNLDLGYRYYDGGPFKGPSHIYANTVEYQGSLLSGKPWKGKLRTHQFTIDFNFAF